MSRINIHRGTFLEKEELTRMIDFLGNNVVWRSILAISKSYGLVSPGSVPGVEFTVSKSATEGCIDITGGYVIPAADMNPFQVPDITGLNVPNGDWWVKISPNTVNYEEGTVAIDESGNVSGTVDFAGIVRSQSSGVPTCVRFVKVNDDGSVQQATNNKIYQILNIVDANTIQLSSGYPFTAESGLKIIVLGSIPLGRKFTDEQQNEGLYTFDSYRISFVAAGNDTPLRDTGENFIARVTASNGIVNTVDVSCRAVEAYCTYWSLLAGGGGGGGTETYTLRIVATPSNAQVVMNGIVRSSITVQSGTSVMWEVSAPNYNSQSGTEVVTGDKTLNINLEEIVGAFEDFEVLTQEDGSESEPFETVLGSGSEQFQVTTQQ